MKFDHSENKLLNALINAFNKALCCGNPNVLNDLYSEIERRLFTKEPNSYTLFTKYSNTASVPLPFHILESSHRKDNSFLLRLQKDMLIIEPYDPILPLKLAVDTGKDLSVQLFYPGKEPFRIDQKVKKQLSLSIGDILLIEVYPYCITLEKCGFLLPL